MRSVGAAIMTACACGALAMTTSAHAIEASVLSTVDEATVEPADVEPGPVVGSAETVPVAEPIDVETDPVVGSAETVPVAEPIDVADPPADKSTARDEAIDLMGAEVSATFGLGESESNCIATLLVDRLGEDRLVVGGALVDLNSFPADVNQLAGQALIASVARCGINPSVFG